MFKSNIHSMKSQFVSWQIPAGSSRLCLRYTILRCFWRRWQ